MPGCITEDYKNILSGLIEQETEKSIFQAIVGAIPLCPVARPGRGEVERAKERKVPEAWGLEPLYVDEKGDETSFSSPSSLIKHLNLPLSGIQCDAEGQKCKATSVVEIMRIHGFTVTGNGEEVKKAGEGGKKMTVLHPNAPQMKKLKK